MKFLTHADGTDEIFNLSLVQGSKAEIRRQLADLYFDDPEEFIDARKSPEDYVLACNVAEIDDLVLDSIVREQNRGRVLIGGFRILSQVPTWRDAR